MNLLLAVVLFAVLLMGFGVTQAITTVGTVSACALPATSERQTCEPGDPAAPGAAAGIEPGDRIVSVAGEPIETWDESTAIIRDHPDEPVDVRRRARRRRGRPSTVTPMLSERYAIDDERHRSSRTPRATRSSCRRASSASAPRPRPCSSP